MLDIKYIREHKEEVKQNCINRRSKVDIDALLACDDRIREISPVLEALRGERNKSSKTKPTPEIIEKMKTIGEEIKKSEKELETLQAKRKELLLQVPNRTHAETPVGDEADFTVLTTHLEPKTSSFVPRDHEALMLERNWIDFERGAKVAGSKFYFVKNELVRLNQALIAYGIDHATKHGFELLETPDLARHEILESAGFNPRGAETQIYTIEGEDISLIGTAEISVLGYHADEVLDVSQGPKKYVAVSHCFRTEAGAYGRTSKGLYRVHQFTKLEMFIFCKPEDSDMMHQELLSIEKEICDGLEIPYRVIDIASGDLGGPAYRKFDIEAWMVMKNDYGEITSTSNCTDYQSRRANIRYKTDDGKTEFVHTLNGTAIVTSRFPIALLENLQNEDGTVRIPKALQPYLGNKQTL